MTQPSFYESAIDLDWIDGCNLSWVCSIIDERIESLFYVCYHTQINS